ncbi:mechanosensitive ion channel protein MscS [Cellulosimicrobium composti]|uniref:Mechanosensitive ion channel protein MscS n=1 Tax=Cellulosimicrobium composti TaxID=2672572 RepID=A0ABX0BGT4_9MICO|nr:mechanosensitive ion channel protein MscS [Cellulosimicrobium composti]NDO90139.1 mechanosensitive ion channel protein MscS [Cellulosimicrobium composti]
MVERRRGRVVIRSARTGRPSTRDRVLDADDVVRIDARIPAYLAEHLYDAAYESGRPVTAVLVDLLASAIGREDEAAMG